MAEGYRKCHCGIQKRSRRKRKYLRNIFLALLCGIAVALLVLTALKLRVEKVELNPAVALYSGEAAEAEFEQFFTELQRL